MPGRPPPNTLEVCSEPPIILRPSLPTLRYRVTFCTGKQNNNNNNNNNNNDNNNNNNNKLTRKLLQH